MHLDMNAFFASVEQRCNPALRGKPIAVIGSPERTVVTTASYEARAFGVKTGMNKYEAKKACPSLIFVIGNNRKYMDTSVRMLDMLKGFSPRIEAYSIDEAFVDLAGCGNGFPSARALGAAIKERIRKELGLTCSVGIAPNKLLAKLASGMEKPDGLVVIEEAGVASLLEDLPVGELWGIGPRLTAHLACLGVRTCGQLGRAPVSVLRERFGIIGERLKLMGQGIDPNPIVPMGEEAEARSVGHSMTLPADITDRRAVRRHLLKLSEMVGARARAHNLRGCTVGLTIRYADFFTFSRQRTLPLHTNDTHAIYRSALAIIDAVRLRSAIRLLGVSISGIVSGSVQMQLFEEEKKRERLLGAMDEINSHFGRFTLTWASLLEEDDAGPGVISPAWRPTGVKSVNVR
ncbi:MAG: DNA polymerase IV [Deltaproteobacteria bacterium]|nr:DNA polymerase IV [Deltaproteobacteria bacterium]